MRTAMALIISLAATMWTTTGSATEPFLAYDCITPNVSFWIDIYTQYTTTQGVVHDSVQLDIVYEVITLKPPHTSNARKINRKRMKQAKRKYQNILRRLAADPTTEDAEAQRVAELFEDPNNVKAFRLAANRVRCQIGQKDRFIAGLIRSGAYIDEIRAIFKSYQLPEDLAYLPHVESSFNPKAYSKFGAAGIWQFTRSTGKRFMKVGYVLDERRDPIRATHAAARLLKKNYNKLGSWPLAITAYNHGAAGMSRAKSKFGDYPAIFQYYHSRTFKFASRNFYSEFIAARKIASHYHTYFGDIELTPPESTYTITLDGYAAFHDLCTHFKVPIETVKRFNPALRPPVFNGQKYVPKGYTLRLPQKSIDGQAQYAAIPHFFYKLKQKPSRFYTVQRGDTAGRIARMHGVPLSDLILANNLNRHATIYPHQTLRIPLPGESIETQQQYLAVKDEKQAKPASVQSVEKEKKAVSETLSDIKPPILASVIPMPELKPVELLSTELSKTESKKPNLEIVTADVRIEKIYEVQGQVIGIIQVEVEETLGHYAEWAGVRTWRIRHLNNLRNNSVMHLHQKIKIPLHKISSQEFEQSRYEYHKRLQEDFFAVYRINELQPYSVRWGDNYWSLCREKFDLPFWLLKHCNPKVNFANLKPRQQLLIPALEKLENAAPTIEMNAEDKIEGFELCIQNNQGGLIDQTPNEFYNFSLVLWPIPIPEDL